jgi:hypothetical protein
MQNRAINLRQLKEFCLDLIRCINWRQKLALHAR